MGQFPICPTRIGIESQLLNVDSVEMKFVSCVTESTALIAIYILNAGRVCEELACRWLSMHRGRNLQLYWFGYSERGIGRI